MNQSNIAQKIPLVAGSERGYVSFINAIRMGLFDVMTESYERTFGESTPESDQRIARLINDFTGRGYLGKALDKHSPLLAMFMFAPRFFASRLRLFGGAAMALGDFATMYKFGDQNNKNVRKYLGRERAKMAAGMLGTDLAVNLGISALRGELGGSGDEEEKKKGLRYGLDLNSSDAGKIMFGDKRLDTTFGLGQYMVYLHRMITGRKTAPSGKVTHLTGPKKKKGESRLTLSTDFMRGKAAPWASSTMDFLDEEDMFGQPTYGEDIFNNAIPITVGDTVEGLAKEGIPGGAYNFFTNFFGASGGIYGGRRDEAVTVPRLIGKHAFGRDYRRKSTRKTASTGGGSGGGRGGGGGRR